jgi:hypothetical protein
MSNKTEKAIAEVDVTPSQEQKVDASPSVTKKEEYFFTLCGHWHDTTSAIKERTLIIDSVELDGERFVLHNNRLAFTEESYVLTHYASGLFILKLNSKKIPLKKLKDAVKECGDMKGLVAKAKSGIKSLKKKYPINK